MSSALPVDLCFAHVHDLADEIATLEAHMAAASYRQLVAIRKFDELEGWEVQGATSCAAWLNWRIGLSPPAARERVRMAQALCALPRISEAFSKGQVSYSQVRAMTRIAEPQNEEDWLNLAHHSTAQQLERMVRDCRQAEACAEPDHHAVEQAARYLHTYFDDDGMLVLKGRLPAVEGVQLQKALAALMALTPPGKQDKDGGDPPKPSTIDGQRQADALMDLVDRAGSGEGVTGSDRYQIVVHADAEALAAPSPISHRDAGQLEHGPAASAEALRRLCCDASIVPMVHGPNGEVVNVGRKRRTIPVAMRRALEHRDQGCRFPSCDNKIVDGHHVVHWVDGGETSLSNMLCLCRRHHGLVHAGGFQVRRHGDDKLEFVDPTGRPVTAASALPESAVQSSAGPDSLIGLFSAGFVANEDTFICEWDGEPPDYDTIASAMTETEPGECS